jgi:hypothetical protein
VEIIQSILHGHEDNYLLSVALGRPIISLKLNRDKRLVIAARFTDRRFFQETEAATISAARGFALNVSPQKTRLVAVFRPTA